MLKLKGVSKYYYKDGVVAVGITKVNLELHIGEFVVITGESGSGKSTLLNVLSGLDTYEDGEMYINGEETSHYTEEDYQDYRRKYVSNIFQNFNLVNSYTVYDNIELSMLLNGKKKREIKKEINELINKVGLKKYRNTKVSKLSGGQKQRVAIARALANDTPIIIADEPTGALDSKSSKEILELLHKISENKLVIVVTHNKSEIEEYATRLIKMHDGKILENKEVKDINLDKEVEEKELKSITGFNKIFYGFKNAFNLPVKLILMMVIFFLISVALITNYASFKVSEQVTEEDGYSFYFTNASNDRIVIKKNDKTVFTEEDYKKIEKIEGIDYVVKNDLMLDSGIGLMNNDTYLYGTTNFEKIDKVDVGRLPENDYEIVVTGAETNWYIGSNSDKEELFNNEYKVDGLEDSIKVKIVGIVYNYESIMHDELKFTMSDTILEELKVGMMNNYNDIDYKLNKEYFDNDYYVPIWRIIGISSINKGEVYVSDELNMYCKNYNCNNNILTMYVKNIYRDDSYDLKITKTYNKNNIKKLVNYNYEEYNGTLFMNKEDYQSIFNTGNYQSSVFVKDVRDLDKVNKDLNDLGFETLLMRDAKFNDMETVLQVLKIIKLIVTVVLIIVLFFISYFIIKIIYKSRNAYYTTIRTLGGTKKVCIRILRNELFVLATFTYIIYLVLMLLVSKNIIYMEYFEDIVNYCGYIEYIIVYVILILLSILISYRYGRKIFKDSIIKTYGERI